MVDSDRLLSLMLAADYNFEELKRLASEYLGTDGAAIMLDGDLSRRTRDLVAWAERHNMLDNLLEGVLLEGTHKRAVREWILNAQDTQAVSTSALDDPRLIRHLTEAMKRGTLASEERMKAEMAASEERMKAEMAASEERIMGRLAATLASTPTHRIADRYKVTFFGAFLLMFAPVLFYYSDVRAQVGVTWYWSYVIAFMLWSMAGALWYYVFFMRVQQ